MFDKRKSNRQGSPHIKESIAMRDDPPVAAQAHSPATKSAVIGPGIQITGDVTATANLKISGHIKGSIIESSHTVEIGESSKINANISAKMVIVGGVVVGNILCSQKVLLSKTGRVQGNIIAPRVQLEDGALFKGSIEMDPGKVAKPKSPAVSKKVGKASPAGSTPKVSGLTLKNG